MIVLHDTQTQRNTVYAGGKAWPEYYNPTPSALVRLYNARLICDAISNVAQHAIGDRDDLVQELIDSFRNERELKLALDTERESKRELSVALKLESATRQMLNDTTVRQAEKITGLEAEIIQAQASLALAFEENAGLYAEIAALRAQLAAKPDGGTPAPAQPAAGDVSDILLLQEGMNELRKIIYDAGVRKSGKGLHHDIKAYFEEQAPPDWRRYGEVVRKKTAAENENKHMRRQLGLSIEHLG